MNEISNVGAQVRFFLFRATQIYFYRRLLVSLSSLISWSRLSAIGRTTPMRLTAIVPLFGTILLFNQTTTEWLKLSGTFVSDVGSNDAMGLTFRNLYFVYFGLCALGIGSIIFFFRCPPSIQENPSETSAIEAALTEDSPVINRSRFWALLAHYFGVRGLLGPSSEIEFRKERLDMPDDVSGEFSVLIEQMMEKAEKDS